MNSERLAAFDEAAESNLEGLGPDKCFSLLLNSDLRKVAIASLTSPCRCVMLNRMARGSLAREACRRAWVSRIAQSSRSLLVRLVPGNTYQVGVSYEVDVVSRDLDRALPYSK